MKIWIFKMEATLLGETSVENGTLVEEGWTCVNADSSVIDEIK